MIKARELRIGSCYLTGLEITGSREAKLNINNERIIKLSLRHIEILSYDNSLINFLYPIPLTEEILLKCGFEDKLPWVKDNTFAYDSEKRLHIKRNVWFIAAYNVQNLHQIQNLYFALTGEEINVNQLV